MEKVIEKITYYRNRKGYSYENMADELNLSIAAYRKIETGETKLSVERLFKISDILKIPVNIFLNLDQNVHQKTSFRNENIHRLKMEYFYQENKELRTELIKVKDQLITQLQKEIEFLRK